MIILGINAVNPSQLESCYRDLVSLEGKLVVPKNCFWQQCHCLQCEGEWHSRKYFRRKTEVLAVQATREASRPGGTWQGRGSFGAVGAGRGDRLSCIFAELDYLTYEQWRVSKGCGNRQPSIHVMAWINMLPTSNMNHIPDLRDGAQHWLVSCLQHSLLLGGKDFAKL